MSEQDSTTRPTEDEDVEAHGRRNKVMASDEAPKDDESDDDDVELHGSSRSKVK